MGGNLQIIESPCSICCKLANMVYQLAVQSEQTKALSEFETICNEYRDITNDELIDAEIQDYIRRKVD